MPRRVQGTEIWFVDPQTDEPRLLTQVTDFQPGGAAIDPIDTTDLGDNTREIIPGLRSPAQATISLNLEPGNAAHRRLFEIYSENPANHTEVQLNWIVGWSDGTSTPTADSALLPVLPTTRTWYTFKGYISDFPMSFPLGGVVNGQITVQRTADADGNMGKWQRKQ